MVGRALLVGAQTAGLHGALHDVALMRELLLENGFTEVTNCSGRDVTRLVLLSALEDLITSTRAGDAVVVHYSGHAARLPRPSGRRREDAQFVRFLVTADVEASTRSRFRGVLAEEVDAAVRRLADVTPNVTVVLDCCHAGGLVRRPGGRTLVPRSVQFDPRDLPVDDAMVKAEVARASGRSNRSVVRVSACQSEDLAYEIVDDDGDIGGLLTSALVAVLRTSPRTPWIGLLPRIRASVGRVMPQRPDVEGPVRRVPFTLGEVPWSEVYPLALLPAGVAVASGRLLGLREGDTLQVATPWEPTLPASMVIGTVIGLVGDDAVLDLSVADVADLPGLVAVPVRTAARDRVEVHARGRTAGWIEQALRERPRLSTRSHDGPPVATIGEAADGIDVADGTGRPVRPRCPKTAEGARQVAGVCEVLAAAERLRTLVNRCPGVGPGIAVTWSLLGRSPGDPDRLLAAPDRIEADDVIRVRVENHTPDRLRLWLLDIGMSGRITLVSNDRPSGQVLRPAGEAGCVWRSAPVRIAWPPDVPSTGPRRETLLLLFGEAVMDLALLDSSCAELRAVPPDAAWPVRLTRGGPADDGDALACALRADVMELEVTPARSWR